MRFPLAREVCTALAAMFVGAAASAAPTSLSPYYTDTQNEFVQDATTDRIGTVNRILCIVGALRADALVNRGPYVALVDQFRCDTGTRAAASRSGDFAAGSQANHRRAVVHATRASNGDPMIARVWFENEDQGQAVDLHIHLTVSQGPTSSNPHGVFTLNYCARDPGGTVPDCLFKGRLAATSGGLAFYEEEATGGSPNTTQLLLTKSGIEQGAGALRQTDSSNGTETALFTFDGTHFLRGDGTTNHCFSRERDDAASSVWHYGVYDETGARLERNSGFPVRYTDNANNEFQGFMGYHGLFLPAAAGAANGDLIVRQGPHGQAETPYTLVKLGGRLTKFTRQVTTLAAVDQVRFTVDAWRFPSAPFAAFATLAGKSFAQAQADNDRIELYWDDASGTLRATALLACGTSGCVSNTFSAEAAVDGTVVTSGDLVRGFPGFSDALGGDVFIGLGGAAPSSSTPVTTREQALVYPDEYPSSVHCIAQCVKGAQLTLGNLQAHDLYYGGNGFDARSSQLRTYVFSGDVLEDPDGAPVISTVPADQLAGTPYQSGIRTGRLADAADLHALTDLDCDPSSPSGFYCADRIDALDQYYVWETGTQPWNRFTALQDSATGYVRFDPPLAMQYAVPTGSAYGNYAGTNLVLQYGGFGNLWGIPGQCVSAVDNTEVSCAAGGDVRFVPRFSIPYSLTAGRVTRNATPYYVKWLDRELRLAPQPLGHCAALTLPSPGGLTLPDAGDVQDPSDPAQPAVYIGPKPSLTLAPAVIHGVVQ